MLIALSCLGGGHALTPCTVRGLTLAPNRLILEMIFRLANGAGFFACLLSSSQPHVFGLTRQIAIGSVVLLTLVGCINNLAMGTACKEEAYRKQ